MLFMPPWSFLLENSCSYQPDGTKISLIHHMGRRNASGTVWAWFELKTLYISKFKNPWYNEKKNSTHWRNVELTWKCSNSTVICISYASETSSTLVNKLVEQVSQACLTSLFRLVEPAWLVLSCLTNVKLVEMGAILTNIRLVVN